MPQSRKGSPVWAARALPAGDDRPSPSVSPSERFIGGVDVLLYNYDDRGQGFPDETTLRVDTGGIQVCDSTGATLRDINWETVLTYTGFREEGEPEAFDLLTLTMVGVDGEMVFECENVAWVVSVMEERDPRRRARQAAPPRPDRTLSSSRADEANSQANGDSSKCHIVDTFADIATSAGNHTASDAGAGGDAATNAHGDVTIAIDDDNDDAADAPKRKTGVWHTEKPHFALIQLVLFFFVGWVCYVHVLHERKHGIRASRTSLSEHLSSVSTVAAWSGIDVLYFAVTTVTTVGYGDISPSTTESKVFTICYAAYGVFVAMLSLMKVANYLLHKQEKAKKQVQTTIIRSLQLATHNSQVSSADICKREAMLKKRQTYSARAQRWMSRQMPSSGAAVTHVAKVRVYLPTSPRLSLTQQCSWF